MYYRTINHFYFKFLCLVGAAEQDLSVTTLRRGGIKYAKHKVKRTRYSMKEMNRQKKIQKEEACNFGVLPKMREREKQYLKPHLPTVIKVDLLFCLFCFETMLFTICCYFLQPSLIDHQSLTYFCENLSTFSISTFFRSVQVINTQAKRGESVPQSSEHRMLECETQILLAILLQLFLQVVTVLEKKST